RVGRRRLSTAAELLIAGGERRAQRAARRRHGRLADRAAVTGRQRQRGGRTGRRRRENRRDDGGSRAEDEGRCGERAGQSLHMPGYCGHTGYHGIFLLDWTGWISTCAAVTLSRLRRSGPQGVPAASLGTSRHRGRASPRPEI